MSSLKDPQGRPQGGKAYWRSLAELAETPEFRKNLENEFPGAPLGESGSFSRRRFMQVMGASMALASGTACRWEKENILPFTRNPSGHVPGVPQHFKTAMEFAGYAEPLVATSYDGRPIKLEGNAQHPMSGGGSSAYAQASVLELYDPDRSQGIIHAPGGGSAGVMRHTWSEFISALGPVLDAERQAGGAGLRVLSEATSSPTIERLQKRLAQQLPQAKWVRYEPIDDSSEVRGAQLAFGQPLRAQWALDKARTIVAIDSDFLTDHPAAVRSGRDFARGRRPQAPMNRLYVIESRFTSTGGTADHRLALRAEQMYGWLLALGAELVQHPALATAPDAASWRTNAPQSLLANPRVQKLNHALARELVANRGRSILLAGAGQPPEVHALVHQLNGMLQNIGSTVTYVPAAACEHADARGLALLADEMQQGKVSTLLVLGGNPVFTAPASVKFAEALGKVKTSIHLSLFRDETSRACLWHLPRAHYLETWADARAYDGTYTLTQPLIKPLYGGKSPAEVLSLVFGEQAKSQALTKQTFSELLGPSLDLDKRWHDTVRAGFLVGSSPASVTPAARPLGAARPDDKRSADGMPENGALELTLWPDSHVYDGRFANNGWLQELPDFMSKLTWDSVAVFGPSTAKALGVAHQTLVQLQVAGRQITTAAYVMPGQAPGSVAVTLGYGRTEAGHVAGTREGDVDPVGFNAYPLFDGSDANFASSLKVVPLGKFYELATTQDHHALDALAENERQARAHEIIREGTLAEYDKEPNFAKEMVEHPPLESLWKEFSYDVGHRWGMAIDLNKCTGCNACVIACQAENNIPIVGKEQVINGREMHWIRIDRYFHGDAEAPEVASQPMLCQQCENAPCEQVCPVAATVHSHEGLNDMVYNRCVGTRYCSNNCPYKVRRFNFFNYHKNLVDSRNQVAKMVYNPEVTVRARGVMEKCNYCVQRIQTVKIDARNHKRPIRDGEITTACAQACAAEAIVFGDLNDPKARVTALQADSRSYAVLEQLNTKPRTTYLAKIRNPNPELS